jgi:hypothetical protein
LRTLHRAAKVERVAAEDVAHVVAADDHHLRPTSSAIAFRPVDSSRATSRWQTGRRQSRTSRRGAPAPEIGHRYRKAPAFHRSSRVSRLSETQSVAGVIWSVSMASNSFARDEVPDDERAATDDGR